MWITCDKPKVVEIIACVLRTAAGATRLSFITLIGIARQRREVRTFFKCRTGTHTHLVNNRIIRQRYSDPAIVGDAACVCLIAWDCTAITVGAAVSGQEMAPRWNDGAIINGQAGRDCSSVIRTANLPVADIDGTVAIVVELDELVIGALRTACAELANDHRWSRCR